MWIGRKEGIFHIDRELQKYRIDQYKGGFQLKEYRSDRLRNVGIIAHGGAGKTSLTESLLFNTGATTRIGRIADGTTITDFEPEEIKRKVTISAALAPCEWQESKINFIDTPGYADFVGEVKGVLRAVDSALVVLCAAAGIEVETEKVWKYSTELDLPKIVFINKMDRENADFYRVVQDMREKFGARILPIQIPIGAEDNFTGIIDLLKMKAIKPANKLGNQYMEEEIPADLMETAVDLRQKLMETVAETDDELLNKYLDGTELSNEEMNMGLAKGTSQGKIFPVLCGSAYKNIGIQQVLDGAVAYLPSPESKSILGTHPVSEELIERKTDDPFSAMVFKTTADPFVGRLSYIRIFSGTMKPDSQLYNASKGKVERVGNIFTLRGKHQEALPKIYAGDIVVVAKLQETGTGDSLCDKDKPIIFEPISYPKPMFIMCIEAKNKGDEDKIGNALHRLTDEDLTFKVTKNTETKQLLISGIGEVHTDIMAERMKRKFGVDVILSDPKVPYRETIRATVKVEGKHKKQSGGHGQYGHVWLQLDPLPVGKEFEFVDSIFGGSVPRQYIPAVEKGVREALTSGVLGGYPMVDVKVTLYDGSYHNVDSSEMAFKIASVMALRKGALQAKPALLEPIYDVQINVPASFMGDVIADLNSKRGRIQGMEPIGEGQGVIKAQVPMSEMFKYAIDLRSITQGRGRFDVNFSHYDEVPQRIADLIITANKKDKAEEH